MRVVLADSARADLTEIADWIGVDDGTMRSPSRSALRDKCETLGSNPSRYPRVLHAGARNLGKLSYRDYLIFYRVLATEVEVVRIVHGKRDWVTLVMGPLGQ